MKIVLGPFDQHLTALEYLPTDFKHSFSYDAFSLMSDTCISEGGLVTYDYIKSYLTCHRSALEEFIMESVSVNDLEDWLHAKKANNNAVAKLDGKLVCQECFCFLFFLHELTRSFLLPDKVKSLFSVSF